MPIFTAMHHRSPTAYAVPRHQHQQHELVLVLRGTLTVLCPAGALPGRPGAVHIFPAGVPHDQGCRGPWHTICVLCNDDDALFASGARMIDSGGDAAVRTWMEQLVALAESGDPDDRASGDAVLTALLHRIRRLERANRAGENRPTEVLAALRRIEAQLDRDLDVGALASTLGLSRSHLGRLFRAHLGCSPLRWHTRLRLERARALLANPYTSVAEVAEGLGFSDANWFVRQFRAMHGLPPGRWRKEHLQN